MRLGLWSSDGCLGLSFANFLLKLLLFLDLLHRLGLRRNAGMLRAPAPNRSIRGDRCCWCLFTPNWCDCVGNTINLFAFAFDDTFALFDLAQRITLSVCVNNPDRGSRVLSLLLNIDQRETFGQ